MSRRCTAEFVEALEDSPHVARGEPCEVRLQHLDAARQLAEAISREYLLEVLDEILVILEVVASGGHEQVVEFSGDERLVMGLERRDDGFVFVEVLELGRDREARLSLEDVGVGGGGGRAVADSQLRLVVEEGGELRSDGCGEVLADVGGGRDDVAAQPGDALFPFLGRDVVPSYRMQKPRQRPP